MPLPAALAARLAKRGIVKPADIEARENEKKEEEEVIAEDYDERDRDRLGGPDDDDPMNIANLEKNFRVIQGVLTSTTSIMTVPKYVLKYGVEVNLNLMHVIFKERTGC